MVFTSLGFAWVFLVLVIGNTGNDPADLVAGMATMTPGARRQARFQQLDYMKRLQMRQSRHAVWASAHPSRKTVSNSRRINLSARLAAVPSRRRGRILFITGQSGLSCSSLRPGWDGGAATSAGIDGSNCGAAG